MKLNEQELLVCDCEGTMSIDIKNLTKSLDVTGELALSTQLCRKQMETFERAAKGGGRLLVACGNGACQYEQSFTGENLHPFGMEPYAG